MARQIYANLYERLVANTRVDEDGCWIWTGHISSRGYGRLAIRVKGKPHPVNHAAHRLMLEETTGWLFPFDEAGHYRCFKPACINPDHLRIETKGENLSTRRGYASFDHCPIPVLFPTPARLLQEAADDAWDGIGSVVCKPGDPIPF